MVIDSYEDSAARTMDARIVRSRFFTITTKERSFLAGTRNIPKRSLVHKDQLSEPSNSLVLSPSCSGTDGSTCRDGLLFVLERFQKRRNRMP